MSDDPDTRPDGGALGVSTDTAPSERGGRGVGFRSLLKREILRFVRRPRNTFLPPAITNILYFAVFGVVLGGRIDQIAGFDYILFILPGLVVLGAISNAFENSAFSIFHGRWNDYIHEVLTSPLSYREQVAAYTLASMLRGLMVGFIIVGVGLVFLPFAIDRSFVPIERPFYLVAFMLVVTTLFASFGVMGGLWAEDFDYLTVLNQFILRPLVFFGGVFYSLDVLPPLYRTLSLLNPMIYMVNGVRYGFLGYADVDPNASLVVLTGLTIAVIAANVALFRRGYGLID
ncbi:ABC transporter permease [Haloglomus halophilum]|uniref:ABC transporter permease n=1 Tax=Haloglomus halophilum TaxID=2962672 RepID=UPI0020CA0F5E|nr:ABC transporter permease [Haloglomus halophilum]